MRYVRVKIRRDTQTSYNRLVPPWEVPILEFIFEEGNVEVLDNENSTSAVYPVSAAEEFGRLAKAYGEDTETGIAHVASVYGTAGRGVKALKEAIDEARKAETAAKPRKAVAGKLNGRKPARTLDPLMV